MEPVKERGFLYLWTYPKKPSITSRLIRHRLGTPYSHVAVATYIKTVDDYRVYQASHGDVNSVLLKNFLKYNDVIFSCEFSHPKELFVEKIKFLEQQTGKKYSVWGALASTFSWLRKKKVGDDGDESFICSEYAYRAYVTGEASDYVEPELFMSILKKDERIIEKGLVAKEYEKEA
jgi:hypothetical protein